MSKNVSTELLRAALLDAATTGDFILKGATRELEQLLAEIVGWPAVGVSSVFGATLLLGMTAADAEAPVTAAPSSPASVMAALKALGVSAWRNFGCFPPSVAGWDVCSWPALMEYSGEHRSRAIVVRELTSAAAATTLGFDAVIWDVAGSHEVSAPGEIAVIMVKDTRLADTLRALRNHGQPLGKRFHHEQVGLNSRVDDIVARYLSKELSSLVSRRATLRRYAQRMSAVLGPLLPTYMADLDGGGGIQVKRLPDSVRDRLDEAGVAVREKGAEGYVISVALHLAPEDFESWCTDLGRTVNGDPAGRESARVEA